MSSGRSFAPLRLLAGGLVLLGAVLGTTRTAGAVTAPAGRTLSPTTFQAYVAASEYLDVRISPSAPSQTVRVTSPAGVVTTCTRAAAGPVFTPAGCSTSPSTGVIGLYNLTSPTAGVWLVEPIETGYVWELRVKSSPVLAAVDGGSDTTAAVTAATIPGRVWTESYRMLQTGGTPTFSFWYQSEHGYLYRAEHRAYNGVSSTFASDATGVRDTDLGPCVSAYRSTDFVGPNVLPNLTLPAPGECGDPYKIFFEPPAADLPATALRFDGTTTWVRPPIANPTISALAFAPNLATPVKDGQVTFSVASFTGQLEVLVDADFNGFYGDPQDRSIPAFATSGPVAVAFDGLDGLGNPIPEGSPVQVRVVIARAGEIHFVSGDVEIRSGIAVERLNGPSPGFVDLHWDDTQLATAGRACVTPILDGTAGVPSAAGVHGWPCADNSNTGIGGSWGDARYLDDWTFVDVQVAEELTVPALVGIPLAQPVVIVAAAGAAGLALLLRRRARRARSGAGRPPALVG